MFSKAALMSVSQEDAPAPRGVGPAFVLQTDASYFRQISVRPGKLEPVEAFN
jgi:hypothetical protein